MEEALRNFPKQFEWEPNIEHKDNWRRWNKFLLCGMGGSHLQGDIFQNAYPGFDISVYEDYGLPCWRDDVFKQTLIIVSSYSGNTEEALSSYQEARRNGYRVAAISTGGELLLQANKDKIPYIQIPDTGIQPRSALGFTFKALAKMVNRNDIGEEAAQVGKVLAQHAEELETQGKTLAEKLRGKIPIIYSSNKNYSVSYNWKIKFNETGKIPAFCNVFPELNHNEMQGFDVAKSTRPLAEKFFFLFLQDTMDHPRIRKRMDVLGRQLLERGFQVEMISLGGGAMLDKIFNSLLVADWTAFYTAKIYNRNPEEVPMVEEFKKLMG